MHTRLISCGEPRKRDVWSMHPGLGPAALQRILHRTMASMHAYQPPPEPSLLLAAPANEGEGGEARTLGMKLAALRRAFRRAALRWHPDRFQQRVALRLPPHEREGANARVAALARQVGC